MSGGIPSPDQDRKPLVSVIIPAYNRLGPLSAALDSVADQSYDNLEVIVVDDGSTEDIFAAVQRFEHRAPFPVQYIRQDNRGPGIARRTGLEHANGALIQYLDSDDTILPTKLARQVDTLRAHPDAVMCYTVSAGVSSSGRKVRRKFSDEPATDLLATALQYRRWHTSSCLWRYPDRRIARWEGFYNGEDVFHDASVGVHHRQTVRVPEELTIYGNYGDSLSPTPTNSTRLARYRHDMLNMHIALYHLLAEHNLLSIQRYCSPLAERFFFVALRLAHLGDREQSLQALEYARKLSRARVRVLEILFARAAVGLTMAKAPYFYRVLFRLHRKIVPATTHCYRSF